MFERPRSGERAILVNIHFDREPTPPDSEEFADLVRSAGAIPVVQISATRHTPEPGYFLGKGKLEELQEQVLANEIEIVLFNHALSPAQERNLERALQCRVLDRTGVILDIFAQRARSFEGKLQVELAQLKHLSTRLVRGWTHLERQKGGIGLRGPGETQLETDRRLLNERIKQINKRLEKVRRQREQGRRARQRAEFPIVSLVGYTNAGKSTLFNHLTRAEVYAADQLFATLDPTLRRVELGHNQVVILADTVGFIQKLPHDLVAAFRSTLDETVQADLLLHVVDSNDPERQLRIEQVNQVLNEIGADEIPQILVYNKIDSLDDETNKVRVERDEAGRVNRVWLSALRGLGLDELREALFEQLGKTLLQCQLRLPAAAGRTRARLYAQATVLQEEYDADGVCLLAVEIEQRVLDALQSEEPQLERVGNNMAV